MVPKLRRVGYFWGPAASERFLALRGGWTQEGGAGEGVLSPVTVPRPCFARAGLAQAGHEGCGAGSGPRAGLPLGKNPPSYPNGGIWSPGCSGPSVQRAVGLLVLTGGLRAGFLIPFRIWFSGDVSGREGTGPRRREMRLDKGEEPASRIPAG